MVEDKYNRDMKQTAALARKTYREALAAARKTYNETMVAANKVYNETMVAANNQVVGYRFWGSAPL